MSAFAPLNKGLICSVFLRLGRRASSGAVMGSDRTIMAFRHLQVLLGLALVLACAQPTAAAAKGAKSHGRPQSIEEIVRRTPMIFFVAKGASDACGPGCSEWIAAEGLIDLGVDQRLRSLLDTLPNKNLPIFFNSNGGNNGGAMALGLTLRQHRLVSGVAQTKPEGCRSSRAIDDACRRLMQSKREHAAHLVTADAHCLSACVLALLGGSGRQVARGAQLGVHSAQVTHVKGVPLNGRLPSVDEVHGIIKHYTIAMGGDPGLVDIAAKISSNRMHYLSRDELTRFGFNIGDSYEAPWNSYQDQVRQLFVGKSVQMREPTGGKYRVRDVRMWCGGHAIGAWFDYEREWLPREVDAPDVIRVVAGESELVLTASAGERRLERASRAGPNGPATSRRSGVASREFLNHAIAARDIVITEVFYANTGPESSRVVKLSTNGLAKSLTALQKTCGWPAATATTATTAATTAPADASIKAKGRAEEHQPR